MFKNILLPTDGSDCAEQAVLYVKGLATQYGATVHVLHVINTPLVLSLPGVPQERVKDSMREEGKRIIEKVIQELGSLSAEGRVQDGDPAEQIIAYTEEMEIDLIVMGTHGRSGLERILLGSVAEAVVRMSPVPVMVIPMSSIPKSQS
ncbi:MAG: universal stress protein [Candidatus Bipolaricaulia bacterium]